jgi:hypothetical protein
MRRIQEIRPLVDSLRGRIAKREGGSPRPLDTDAVLHRRSLDAITELAEALKDLSDDIAERFDLDSPSTNPGIKIYVEQARAAIAKATQPLNPA